MASLWVVPRNRGALSRQDPSHAKWTPARCTHWTRNGEKATSYQTGWFPENPAKSGHRCRNYTSNSQDPWSWCLRLCLKFKGWFSHIRWSFFRILPVFVPPTQVAIPSANLDGKFTIGCCRRQEGWHILRCGRSGWMDQGSWWSYIFCGAAVFCTRSAPIHDVDDDSICNDKVVLFVLWHWAVAVVVVCCGYAYIYSCSISDIYMVCVMVFVVIAILIIVMVGVSHVKDLQKLWMPKQLLGLIELGMST